MKTLTAFCDLSFCPVSYDFVTWLIRAMRERDAYGCDGLHVVLIPCEDGLGGFARHWGDYDEAAARWRLWHIVMACVPMVGATVTLATSREQALLLRDNAFLLGDVWWPEGRAHLAGPLVEASRKGESIPKLNPTEAARRYVSQWLENEKRPLVTLTTRSQTTLADRNSNMDAWEVLEEWIGAREYRVMRLQDTNTALSEHDGYWSELDPDLRLALYERAAMNLIGNNGPAVLMLFSDVPYIQFGVGIPEKWIPHMAEHLLLQHGDQLPWARADQRLVWKPDTFEVMREEFEAWENGPR